ncbi:hypothetical protein [Ferrimonas marina]|uniref:Lecithin retinol acyltransferase n=1 Tax=Ferrimonas marina TaxID=299255 RepID=A0A1M5YVM7_9GAMM|nr:hypothetical protein [Ferrimonas marina]SHI16147.1 hypothetical protein SAMN02745129_4531 [Ferrimonas marina]
MALPVWLLLAGAAAAVEYRAQRNKIQARRYFDPGEPGMALSPSQWLPGARKVEPTPGSVVVCHVFGVVEHSGIWLGDDTIAELHGSGLIRGISPKRFLHKRSGARIYVCCDRHHRPLGSELAAQRAAEQLFTARDYHLRNNNCHRFVWSCLSGSEQRISSFHSLNRRLADHYQQALYWDPCLW